MEYNVHEINENYDFKIQGVSYIGSPMPNTAMYVTKKVAYLLENIRGLCGCLVFAEEGIAGVIVGGFDQIVEGKNQGGGVKTKYVFAAIPMGRAA